MTGKRNKAIFCPQKQQVKGGLKPANFSDFVKYGNFFYISIGMQVPYEELNIPKVKSLLSHLVFAVGIINLNVLLLCEIIFVAKAFMNGNNFVEATMVLSYVGFIIVGNGKLYFVWRQRSILTRFVNGLKHIFPDNVELQQSYDLPKYLRRCSRNTLGFSVLYMILIWTYNLLCIAQYVICDRLLGMTGIEQTLPYMMYIPWDWHHHWSYYPLCISHNLGGYTAVCGQISSDLLLMGCTTQLVMHFDYLSRKIAQFQFGGSQKGCSRAETRKKNMEVFRNITRYHAKLLDLSEQINHILGVPLLLNFITSSFVICFLGFELTIGAAPEIMIKLVLFLISSATQLYLICHHGQQLLDSSINVSRAVYNQNWFCADVRYQKMLVLIVARAQRPAQLRATKFVSVSLDTMSVLLQISYKFFAVLRTMYSKK